jgi:hypothetical protein
MARKGIVPSPDTAASDGATDFPFGANAEASGSTEDGGTAEPNASDSTPPDPAGPETPATLTPPAVAPDPFDPATYRVKQNLMAAAGVRQVLTDLPVTPPQKSWWCRRHPDPEFSFDAWVIELKDEGETYLVLPPLWASLMGEPCFRPKTFYLATTMQGKLFLWPVRRPIDNTKEPDRWMRAPLEAIRLARDKWVRIAWNEQTRQHNVATCESEVEPEWPDSPFRELLKIAFRDFVINSLDHPVLRRLRGKSK